MTARTYAVRPAGGCFLAVADPPLPDGTAQVERPERDLALAVARLWRLEHGGKLLDQPGRRA